MPEIGRPRNISNPFQGIRKAAGERSETQNTDRTRRDDIGGELNRLAGVQEENQFVDGKKHNQLGKDAFLKLLSNQLQNQDPFNPTDQKKFAADLAQFSQLEQLANLNSKFEKSNTHAPHQMKFMGASFLGKEVLTKGTSIEHDGKVQNINLPFSLSKPAKKLIVRVFDKSNNIIDQIELDGRGKGPQSVLWDGRSLDGAPAVEGTYRFEVRAWDDQFNEFRGDTKAKGVVTGVSFEGSEVVLTVNGRDKVYLRDIDNFSLPSNQRSAEKSTALNKAATQTYNKVENKTLN